MSLHLFANQRDANLRSTVAMIELVLIELGTVLADARLEVAGCARAWQAQRGSARLEVSIRPAPEQWTLKASASVMTVDATVDRPRLMTRLLELNAERTAGVAFAMRGDTVLLLGQRSTRDLDQSEVRTLIEHVLADTDRYDDELVAEFGGRLG